MPVISMWNLTLSDFHLNDLTEEQIFNNFYLFVHILDFPADLT